ncbi:hypothetical protein [Streptomyces sp. NRAIS3]
MHGVHVLAVEPVLDQPFRIRRPALLALPSLVLEPFLVGDPPVDQGELPGGLLFDDAAGEPQHVQTRGRLVHLPAPLCCHVCPLAEEFEHAL